MAGIVGYGAYIPIYRIKTADIARVWGEEPERIEKGLGIIEKAVADLDEDTSTISVMAAENAIRTAGINPQKLGAIYVGSESHPYAVKPTATIVAEAVGATPNLTAADLEFACKAGTAGLQMVLAMVDSKMIEYGMTIGADTAQGRPGDALEYSAASGGAALIAGPEKESLAIVEDTFSFTTDTPDFWRRQKADYPSHGGRFTGSPAYFKHVIGATKGLLEKTGMKLDEFDHVVFHQPNAKFPIQAAKIMGIPKEKLKVGLLNPVIGNTYSGAVPLGLSAVLDVAEPDDMILATSFGSGAGGDSFSIKVTEKIKKNRGQCPTVDDYIKNKKYIDYATYLKYRGKLKV